MTKAKTRGYILKFRCVSCGRYEASAAYPCEAVKSVDEVKTGIYEAKCTACGWDGEVCGFSAVQIYYSLELEVKAQGQGH